MDILNNSLKNVLEYQYSNKQEKNTVHIAYGIDNNYARCMATSIASFCINNPNQQFTFHIMADGLSVKTKEKIEQLAKYYKINIYVYEINTNFLSTLPTKIYLTTATYFRFLLPLILKDIEKVYYVDADIICLQNARNIFEASLNDNIIGAVSDLPWLNKKRNKALNLVNHVYFNAGMLVIDIKKWNKFNTFEKVLQVIQENPHKFRYLDQDALNLVLKGYIQYFDTIYNCIDINSVNKQDIVLLHFAANPKPWSICWDISPNCNDFNRDVYQYYEKKTPWANELPQKPRNYKEMEFYAKCLRRHKRYKESFSWYLKYLIAKLQYLLKI